MALKAVLVQTCYLEVARQMREKLEQQQREARPRRGRSRRARVGRVVLALDGRSGLRDVHAKLWNGALAFYNVTGGREPSCISPGTSQVKVMVLDAKSLRSFRA